MIDEEVKHIFDAASEACEKLLSEHADELRAIAEYLLEHETMDAEEFNYFFEHGSFMPESAKAARNVKHDDTIERPARKISMTDGYAEEKNDALPSETAASEPAPQTEPSGENKE